MWFFKSVWVVLGECLGILRYMTHQKRESGWLIAWRTFFAIPWCMYVYIAPMQARIYKFN